MGLVTVDARNDILSFNLPEIDNVYVNIIPTDAVDTTTTNDMLITEVTMKNDAHGNDDFNAIIQTIEVQLFYSSVENYTDNIEDFEIRLMKLMGKKDWLTTRTDPHLIDPSTQQTVKLFYFERVRYL